MKKKRRKGIGIILITTMFFIVLFFQWNYVVQLRMLIFGSKYLTVENTEVKMPINVHAITGPDSNMEAEYGIKFSLETKEGIMVNYSFAPVEAYTEISKKLINKFTWKEWDSFGEIQEVSQDYWNSKNLRVEYIERTGKSYLRLSDNDKIVGYAWIDQIESFGDCKMTIDQILSFYGIMGYDDVEHMEGYNTFKGGGFKQKLSFKHYNLNDENSFTEKGIYVILCEAKPISERKYINIPILGNHLTEPGIILSGNISNLYFKCDIQKGIIQFQDSQFSFPRSKMKILYQYIKKCTKDPGVQPFDAL